MTEPHPEIGNLYGEPGSTAGLAERAVGHDGGMHVIAGEYIAG